MGGCFFVKKWTFPKRRVHYVQYRYFLFYILLFFGGGVRTHPTHPLPTGLVFQVNMVGDSSWFSASTSRRNITAARGGSCALGAAGEGRKMFLTNEHRK